MMTLRARRWTMLVVILVLLSSCTRIYNERDRSTTTTTPTSPTPPVTRTTIEFRVVGNASSARIRYSTPVDGLTQVISSLPYSSSFSTAATSLFLSLEVTPLSYPLLSGNPFLAIQIVVNGALFREATANDLSLTTLSVSGTWRQ